VTLIEAADIARGIVNRNRDVLNEALASGDGSDIGGLIAAVVLRGYVQGRIDAGGDEPTTDPTVPDAANVVSIFDPPKR
jgi:hypothetical protein